VNDSTLPGYAEAQRRRPHGFGRWSRSPHLSSLCRPPPRQPELLDIEESARSLLAGTDVSRDHAERLLGHVIPGVEGTYNRHDYIEEKAHALKALAGAIDAIINPRDGNVVPLRTMVP